MKKYKVSNLSCASCAATLEKELNKLASTQSATVNFTNETAVIDTTNENEALTLATQLGYPLQSVETNELRLTIQQISCASCVANIEDVVAKLDNVVDVNVSLASKKALIIYTHDKQKIIDTIHQLGYDTSEDEPIKSQSIHSIVWLSILGTLLFILAMAPMLHIPLPSFLDPHHSAITHYTLQFILCIIIIILCSSTLISGAKKLFKAHPNMDSLIFIGVSASLIYSLIGYYHILLNHHSTHTMLYFESAGMILVFVKIGKYFEERSKHKSYDAMRSLLEMAPQEVELKNGEIKNVKDINVGDIVVVRPGMRLSLDGEVVFGNSFVDESFLTGESIPNEKTIHSPVFAGTINQNGYLEYQVTKPNKLSTLSKIVEMVEEAQNTKAPIAKIADIISGYFVWGVLTIAVIAFITWLFITNDFQFAFNIVISILVIACPCALGLATPIAILVGSSKASTQHILFKSATSLQKLSEVDYIVFDKTGTITLGQPELSELHHFSDENILQIVASIEKASEHPLGKAIVEYAKHNNVPFLEIDQFEVYTSKGISGYYSNHHYHIGNIKLMQHFNVDLSEYQSQINTLYNKGATLIYIAKDQHLVGIYLIKDALKPHIKQVIEYTNKHHINTMIISGDHHLNVAAVAKEVGIQHYIAETFPEDKHLEIKKLQDNGHTVAMIGDGINDSIALSSADVGIAIGNGSQIAVESAEVVLMHSDILDLAIAIDIAKKTMRIVYENLFWAFIYNTIGIIIASGLLYSFGILLHPMFAAFAMSFSSVSVVLNALRLLKYKFKY